MIRNASLSLNRRGSFFVRDQSDDSTQCGRTRGQRELFYEVRIDSIGEDLDQNGFLIDNNAVQSYFELKYSKCRVFKSCEIIALTAIGDLRKLVGLSRCHKIRVEIKPGDHAGIVAEKSFKGRLNQ